MRQFLITSELSYLGSWLYVKHWRNCKLRWRKGHGYSILMLNKFIFGYLNHWTKFKSFQWITIQCFLGKCTFQLCSSHVQSIHRYKFKFMWHLISNFTISSCLLLIFSIYGIFQRFSEDLFYLFKWWYHRYLEWWCNLIWLWCRICTSNQWN